MINVTEPTKYEGTENLVPMFEVQDPNNPNETVDGFLAHEVSDVVALAVTGVKDETKTKCRLSKLKKF